MLTFILQPSGSLPLRLPNRSASLSQSSNPRSQSTLAALLLSNHPIGTRNIFSNPRTVLVVSIVASASHILSRSSAQEAITHSRYMSLSREINSHEAHTLHSTHTSISISISISAPLPLITVAPRFRYPKPDISISRIYILTQLYWAYY